MAGNTTFIASGPGYPVMKEEDRKQREYLVPGMTTDGPFVTVRGAGDTVAYPSQRNSLHTLVRDRINPQPGTKPNFWERTAYTGLVLLLVTYLVSFATNLSYVIVQEKAIPFGLEYAIIAGLSVALQLYITLPIIHRMDGVLQIFEIWFEHYSLNVPAIWQRLLFWFICMVVDLGAQCLAAWSVWAIQVDNAVTFAGLPTVVGNEWRAAGILLACYTLIYWVFYHSFYNPEAASDANNSNAPVMVGLAFAVGTYISSPYTGGGLSFTRYIASSIISGHWPVEGWVYAASALVGAGLASLFFYFVTRTTKDGSLKND